MRTLPDRMLAKLPPEMRNDPQIQQEVARLALEAISSQTLEAIGGDGDAPVFLPAVGQVFNVGQPNADTIYRAATITPGGSYRMRGKRGSLRLSVLAQVAPRAGPADGPRAHLNLAELKADADGRYDLLLSAQRPAGYAGDWWQLDPQAIRLMLRMVSADWGKEAEPTFSLERIDKPMGRKRPPAATLEGRLRELPKAIDFIGPLFVDACRKDAGGGLHQQVALVPGALWRAGRAILLRRLLRSRRRRGADHRIRRCRRNAITAR